MVEAAEALDERLTIPRELAHVCFDVRRDSIDGDEQRELAVTQRVENLSVVATRPDVLAVGHHPQPDDVFTHREELPHGTPNACQGEPSLQE